MIPTLLLGQKTLNFALYLFLRRPAHGDFCNQKVLEHDTLSINIKWNLFIHERNYETTLPKFFLFHIIILAVSCFHSVDNS